MRWTCRTAEIRRIGARLRRMRIFTVVSELERKSLQEMIWLRGTTIGLK